MNLRKYKDEDKAAINNLILDDDFVLVDTLICLEEDPQCGLIVEEDDMILAVGGFTGASKESCMTIYVAPSRRKEEIGTMLLKALEENMAKAGVEKIICDFKANELEKSFLCKNGYKHWFYTNYMSYTGGKLTVDNYKFIDYEDKYYAEGQKIYSEAFHKMRQLVGIESKLSLPSEKERNAYKENAENIFLLYDNNQIMGISRLEDDEVGGVAVAVDEQGKGYGKALVSYSVNKLIDRGYEKVTLWAVEGNPAKFLYEKLGFRTERLHELLFKSIK